MTYFFTDMFCSSHWNELAISYAAPPDLAQACSVCHPRQSPGLTAKVQKPSLGAPRQQEFAMTEDSTIPTTELPIYGSKPTRPGMYLGLFHGRD